MGSSEQSRVCRNRAMPNSSQGEAVVSDANRDVLPLIPFPFSFLTFDMEDGDSIPSLSSSDSNSSSLYPSLSLSFILSIVSIVSILSISPFLSRRSRMSLSSVLPSWKSLRDEERLCFVGERTEASLAPFIDFGRTVDRGPLLDLAVVVAVCVVVLQDGMIGKYNVWWVCSVKKTFVCRTEWRNIIRIPLWLAGHGRRRCRSLTRMEGWRIILHGFPTDT
jgi:hypothetical protein